MAGTAPYIPNKAVASALWPAFAGLATCRIGAMVAHFGGDSIGGFVGWRSSMLLLFLMAAALLALMASKLILSQRAANRLLLASVIASVIVLIAGGALQTTSPDSYNALILLNILEEAFSICAMFCWLRGLRGVAPGTVVAVVFGSVALAEALAFALAQLPATLTNAASALLVLTQIMWMRYPIPPQSTEEDFFAFASTAADRRTILIRTALAISLLCVLAGCLLGFPDGIATTLRDQERLLYTVVAVLSCTGIALMPHLLKRANVFFIMIACASVFSCIALLAYLAFPFELARGAVFANAINALMVGCIRYVIVAFMTLGSRDPFRYALQGWIVWLAARTAANMAQSAIYPMGLDDDLLVALQFCLLGLTLLVLAYQPLASSRVADNVYPDEPGEPGVGASTSAAEEDDPSADAAISRLMGINDDGGLSENQRTQMRARAESLARRFQLSERETEAVALYALGFTQQRVAEEMHVTAGTAHEFIKRIYAKTDLHSRQQLIDFMEEYPD